MVLGDLAGLAVSDDGGLLLGEEAHFVDGAFGADAVDDADTGVSDGDKDEEEIFVGANRDNHEGEDEVDEVENGEGVPEDDSADGIGILGRSTINLALLDFGLDLRGSEAGECHRIIVA